MPWTDSDETFEIACGFIALVFLLPFALSWVEDWLNKSDRRHTRR